MGIEIRTCSTLDEARSGLGGGAHYFAGGTLLMRRVNEGDVGITTLVRASDPDLSGISVNGGGVRIGAGVTMSRLGRKPELEFLAPVSRGIGGPAVRNMATVGGNLFAKAPYGDLGTALLALDAVAEIDGKNVPLSDLFAGKAGSGLVQAVRFALPDGADFRFAKVTRVKPAGAGLMTLAAVLEMHGEQVSSARIAIGGMSPRPVRATSAERKLEGQPLTDEGIAASLTVCGAETAPEDDALASAWYRREVLPVHLKRLLLG